MEPSPAHQGIDVLLTTAEVAEICRTSPSTVRYWRHRGEGPPAMRVGRRVLYPRAGLTVWLAGRLDPEDAS